MAGDPKRIRLQKFIADCGLASRRDAEKLIGSGRVVVNGIVVTTMGTTVNPESDHVLLDGKPVGAAPVRLEYYALNKPPGYLVASRDMWGRKTIYELLRAVPSRVVPVGRLDLDSEGLLILTNDGELAYRMMHPRYHMEKEYEVEVQGRVSTEALEEMRSPIEIEGHMTQPARVSVIRRGARSTWLSFVIREGRKRQVRVLCENAAHAVLRLIRVREGPVRLGSLQPSSHRPLNLKEVELLKKAVGLS